VALSLALGVIAAALGWAWLHDRRRTLPRSALAVFAAIAAAMTLYTFTRPLAVYSGDEAIKIAQVAAIADGHLALSYAGAELDPRGVYFPHASPFVLTEGGNRYGIYSIVFTAPSAIGWRLFGDWGLHLLPLLGGLLAVWYAMVLAHRALGSARWTIAAGVVVLTTPLAINASIFNEHALSCGLVMLALAHASVAAPGRLALIASGAAISTAVAVRPEIITGLPALALFTGLVSSGVRDAARRIGWMILGGIPPLTVYVLSNYATIGVASQLSHRDYNLVVPRIQGRDLYPADLKRVTRLPGWYIGVPAVLALIPPLRWPAIERWRTPVIAAAAAVWLVTCARYLHGVPAPEVPALFMATPLFLLALARGPYRFPDEPADAARLTRALWCLVIVGIAAMVVVNGLLGHGARMGARYLMPYMPVLAICALTVAARSRWLLGVAALAFALGVWAQAINHQSMMKLRTRNAATVREVRSRPEIHIFSGLFWGSQVTGTVWAEKQHFRGGAHIGPLLREIKRRGYPGVLEVVGGVREWVALDLEPRMEQVPIPFESPHVRVYRFVEPRR
jgi:hypothetical protein